MARKKEIPEDVPIEAPKTPTDALASGRGGTPAKSPGTKRASAAPRAGSRQASGSGAPKAAKRVSGTRQLQRKTAAKEKRGSAKEGALRLGRATHARQTTQRRSNKGGRASGP